MSNYLKVLTLDFIKNISHKSALKFFETNLPLKSTNENLEHLDLRFSHSCSPQPGSVQVIHGTIFFNFHGSTKLLVVVLGPDGVEDAASARFVRYGRKIDILTCLWLEVRWKLDLKEPR